jgi:hypothetical protein
MEPTGRRRDWERSHAQSPPDAAARITQAGIVAAVLLVGLAWFVTNPPDLKILSGRAGSSAFSSFDQFFSDAFAALRSPISLQGEMFGSSLALGAGRDPGAGQIFRATAGGKRRWPRLHWRADLSTHGNEVMDHDARENALVPPGARRVDCMTDPDESHDFPVSPVLPSMKLSTSCRMTDRRPGRCSAGRAG